MASLRKETFRMTYTRSPGVWARARHGGSSLDLELHVGVLGRPRAVQGGAGLVVRVSVVLDVVVPSRVLMRRGLASATAETAPHRRPRETCGGGYVNKASTTHSSETIEPVERRGGETIWAQTGALLVFLI